MKAYDNRSTGGHTGSRCRGLLGSDSIAIHANVQSKVGRRDNNIAHRLANEVRHCHGRAGGYRYCR